MQSIRGGGFLFEKANPESVFADLAYSVSAHFQFIQGHLVLGVTKSFDLDAPKA